MIHIKSFTSYINESLTEGLMGDLHQLAKEAKSAKDFTDRFFAQHGDKVKRNRDSEEWVKSLYADSVKEDYFAGISKSTAAKKKTQMTKQAKMADDDPAAYKELPGDTKGKKLLKTSDHTKKYHELYGEGALGIVEGEDISEDKGQSTDRSPLDSESLETGVKNKADESGAPIGILRAVMRRGLAAWKTGHRPGASQAQWAYARTNSFLTGGEGTWGGADADLAKEARKAGFRPKK
jgi:hypothetical protein